MRSAAVQGDKLNFDLGYEEKNANFRIHEKMQVFQFIHPVPLPPPPFVNFCWSILHFLFWFCKNTGCLRFRVFVFMSWYLGLKTPG